MGFKVTGNRGSGQSMHALSTDDLISRYKSRAKERTHIRQVLANRGESHVVRLTEALAAE
jgi:hypothetical protein